MRATHVVFTHLDEVPQWGRLWDYLFDGGIAPLFLATGPSLTGDAKKRSRKRSCAARYLMPNPTVVPDRAAILPRNPIGEQGGRLTMKFIFLLGGLLGSSAPPAPVGGRAALPTACCSMRRSAPSSARCFSAGSGRCCLGHCARPSPRASRPPPLLRPLPTAKPSHDNPAPLNL